MFSLVSFFTKLVPVGFFMRVFGYVLRARISGSEAKSRMVALLKLQAQLNNLLADAGVAYGEGIHVKHRLTRYHDFFVDRISSEDRVLDIGCGNGVLAADIARRSGARVVGIDLEKKNIEQARQNIQREQVDLVHGDATRHDFSGSPFDVLVLSNVLEHIEHRPQFLKTLFAQTGAARALIRVPVIERDWTVPMRQELGLEWRLDTTHFTEYTVPQFMEEIGQSGAEVKDMQIRWSEIWAVVLPVTTASDK